MFEISITERVHRCVSSYIQKGDVVIDATMGNGYDTLFLARSVGRQGIVLSYDIQEQAIDTTFHRLIHLVEDEHYLLHREAGVGDIHFNQGIYLLHKSHDTIEQSVDDGFPKTPEISCIMFNFGYLPGADKHLTTKVESSLEAVKKSLDLVKAKGIVSLVTYPGHKEGLREDLEIKKLLQSLSAKVYEVLQLNYVNRSEQSPKQYLIYKL